MFKQKAIWGVVAAALIFVSAPAFAVSGDAVVATVNGEKVLKKDVDKAMKSLPVQGQDADKIFPVVVDHVINEKLIDKEIAKAKVEETAEFKERLALMRDQLVKQIYVEKYLKKSVSEGRVKDEYSKFKSENSGKKEIHARHILVPTEEEAKQVVKDLDGGAKFEDLAKKRSSGPSAQNGGDLGFFAQEDMLPEFSKAAFAIKPGTYGKTPVKTQFGWHVIKVEESRSRKVPALSEIEGPIRSKLGQEALEKLILDLRAKADIKRYDDKGKEIAEPKKN